MRAIMQTAMAGFHLYSEYICGMLISITIARSLTTTEYGLYSSIIFVASVFTLSVNAGMNINVTKFVAEVKHKAPDYLAAFFHLVNRLFLIRLCIAISIIALVIWFDFDFGVSASLVAFILLGASFKARYMLNLAIMKGIRRFDKVALVSLIVNPLNLLAVIICAVLLPGLTNFLIIYAVTCLLFWLVVIRISNDLPSAQFNEQFEQHYRSRFIKQMISATFVVIFAGFTFRQSQVLVLQSSDFLEAAGFFNIAFILSGAAITLVPGIYKEILLPKIVVARENKAAVGEVLQAERYLIILAGLVIFPLIIYAKEVIALLYGERYMAAVQPLQWLMFFKFIGLLKEGANLTLISHDKQDVLAWVNAGVFALMCLLSLLLVSNYGLMAAVWVYGSLSIVQLIGYMRFAKPFDYKMMPITSLLRILIPGICMALVVMFLNRYIDGWWRVIPGSIVFIIGYVHLLVFFRAFDTTGQRLFHSLQRKSPQPLKIYFRWASQRLTPE
ncbi:oligosaccharide flippase family protein [Thalassotalea sp. Y01]|uniref:lipopolysaccharide biosynthesis protein n=1 Tax=Thalassotalea sp. Y01 TaxID=2729613 RepID=UPI00145F1723|nr:oligosaccharide flippase family protein [Thalassotalea sp. Y01]NMP16184.1 oligosaccharide flippase family protein [Thalassotalea sp. Y01]